MNNIHIGTINVVARAIAAMANLHNRNIPKSRYELAVIAQEHAPLAVAELTASGCRASEVAMQLRDWEDLIRQAIPEFKLNCNSDGLPIIKS